MLPQVSSILVVLMIVAECCRADQYYRLPETPAGSLNTGSINDLAKRPAKLDPKLRKALLRVLTRLDEEDRHNEYRLSAAESQQQQQLQEPQPRQLQDVQQQQLLPEPQHLVREEQQVLQDPPSHQPPPLQGAQSQQQEQQRERDGMAREKQQREVEREQRQRVEVEMTQQQLNGQRVEVEMTQQQIQEMTPRQLQMFQRERETQQQEQVEMMEQQRRDQMMAPRNEQEEREQRKQLLLREQEQQQVTQLLQQQQVHQLEMQIRQIKQKQLLQQQQSNTAVPAMLLPTPNPSTDNAGNGTTTTGKSPTTPVSTAAAATSSSNKNNQTARTVVDFFEAPLLTAFTLQQDASGVSQRVVPLLTESADREGQKILALEARAERERNAVVPDARELERLKSAELARIRPQPIPLNGLQRESFAIQEQLRFQQKLLELQQQQQQQRAILLLRQQRQQQPPVVVQQLQSVQPQPPQHFVQIIQPPRTAVQQVQSVQLQPLQQQQQQVQFRQQRQQEFGSFVPEHRFARPQSRVLRQPHQQHAFGFGLPPPPPVQVPGGVRQLHIPGLPSDLDVVYKVLALNHDRQDAPLQRPLLS